MSGVTVEYRGYTIRWSDNQDCWSCMDLGLRGDNPSLAKIKAQIDRLFLAERKAAGVQCFELSSSYGTATRSEVIEYLGEVRSWSGKDAGHKVASVAQRHGNERASRREVHLSDMMPDTPDAHAAFSRYRDAYEEAKAAEQRAREAFKAIPRLSVTDIAALVALAKAEGTTP